MIPAALLVTVAYVKGRLDARALVAASAHAPVAPAPPIDPILRAQAEAADAVAIAEAQIAASGTLERPSIAEPLDWSLLTEWATGPASSWPPERSEAPEAEPDDEPEAVVLSEWTTPVTAAAAVESEPEPVAEPEQVAELEPVAEPVVEILMDERGRFSLGGWAAQEGHMALCGVTFRHRRDGLVDPASIRLTVDAASNVADGGLVVLADTGFAPDLEGFTILLAASGPGSFAAAGRYEVVA
jgi:hypothetical protein